MSFDEFFFWYLSNDKVVYVVEEAQSGISGAHQFGPKLYFRIERMEVPNMVQNSMNYVKKCEFCQVHVNFITGLWIIASNNSFLLFDSWDLDLIGPITSKISVKHSYILAGADYFSR